MIEFFVPGVPIAKGSTKAFFHKQARKIITRQTNADKQAPWASIIALYAQQAGASLMRPDDGVDLRITFYMPRPKCDLRKDGTRKPTAPPIHVKKPDLDKLIRCVKDALTGVAWHDDSQVNVVHAHKTYQDQHPHNLVGAKIRFEAC